LIVIFGVTIYNWTPPSYGGVIFYPDWAHGVGWFLTLIVAVQIPLGAVIAIIYYSIKGRPLDAFRPSPDWGPGDKVSMLYNFALMVTDKLVLSLFRLA
jgi:hypothetical protein